MEDRKLDGLRLEVDGTEIPTRGDRISTSGPYVPGPVPFHPFIDQMAPATRLFFALLRQRRMLGGGWGRVSQRVNHLAGLDTRSARRNALLQLEKWPNISVRRSPGAYPEVHISTGGKANGADRSPQS